MAKTYSVTSAGVNPAEDRAHRMRMYFIAMSLRVLCVVSLFWVHGWWILIPAFGAVILPWFAVMVGNAVAHGGEVAPEALAPQELEGSTASDDASDMQNAAPAADAVIVIDVEPTRRASSTPAEDAPTAEHPEHTR